MSLSEGGGEPSTQPFHPFFAAALFLRGGADKVEGRSPKDSSSSGVCGLLDDVRDVLEEIEGPGVDAGVEACRRGESVGDGVTETERR